MKFILDTHTAVWLASAPQKLGVRAGPALAGLATPALGISDVTLSEIARLIRQPKKGLYVSVDRRDWLDSFAFAFTIVPVTAAIADRTADYGIDHRDPCDRHILATADILGLPLITIDAPLTACAESVGVRVLW